MKFFKKKAYGMSLVELLIGAGIFVMVMSISGATGMMIYKGKAKIQYTNELYTETRFMMERMIHDVRVNTIDYYEYFSQNTRTGMYSDTSGLTSTQGKYGENPGLYEMFFYFIPHSEQTIHDVSDSNFSWKSSDRNNDINIGVFNTHANNTDDTVEEFTLSQSKYSYSLGDSPDIGLFLLSSDGQTKIMYRYVTKNIGTDDERGEIEVAKMKLVDIGVTGNIRNVWRDFYDHSREDPIWTSITPPSINITNFTFFLSPRDDPQKSFAKSVNSTTGETVQIQPHVILKLSTRLSNKNARAILGKNNIFTIQSSASSRVFHNVTFPRQ